MRDPIGYRTIEPLQGGVDIVRNSDDFRTGAKDGLKINAEQRFVRIALMSEYRDSSLNVRRDIELPDKRIHASTTETECPRPAGKQAEPRSRVD